MPPNINNNQDKNNPIYPEPTTYINPNNSGTPPIVLSQKEEPKHVPRRKRWIMLAPIAVLLVISGASAAVLVKHSSQNSGNRQKNTASNATKSPTADYYLPPDNYDGPFTYKFSGTITRVGQAASGKPSLVSEFNDGTRNIQLRQPLEVKDNYCKGSSSSYSCDKPYQTAKGRTIYPMKESGAYLEIDSHVLNVTGVDLGDAAQRSAFDAFVDQLSPLGKGQLSEYNQSQRKKAAWIKLYSLPYPVYAPASTPNGLPVKYQDISVNSGLYGSDQPFLSTHYTNKASAIGVDNASSTYKFIFAQLQKPSTFNPATNCLVGTKKYSCAEMHEVATSPTSKATIDTSKYHLYKDKASGGYISTTLIADFGKTLIVIDMYGPTNVFREELGASVVNSLNTMAPTNLADLQYISVNMTEGI